MALSSRTPLMFVLALSVASNAIAQHTIIEIPTLSSTAVAYDVSENGLVVGEGDGHAFSWSPATGITDVVSPTTFASPSGVNSRGQVVGAFYDSSGVPHAFSWTRDGGTVDISVLVGPGTAEGVNETGTVVGNATMGPFLWSSVTGVRGVGGSQGAAMQAIAVNNLGQVAGNITFGDVDDPSRFTRAFVWSAAEGLVVLGTVGGTHSSASGINNLGHVVGSSYNASGLPHAFFWTLNSGMVDLTPDGGVSAAFDVNDSDEVVGTSSTYFSPRPAAIDSWLWSPITGMTPLPALEGQRYTSAYAINNAGQVVGTSGNRAVMWLPADQGGGAVDVVAVLNSLSTQVAAAGLHHGLANALGAKLRAAAASWQRGNETAATNQLKAFTNHLDAQRGKKIALEQADGWFRAAEDIAGAIRTGNAR